MVTQLRIKIAEAVTRVLLCHVYHIVSATGRKGLRAITLEPVRAESNEHTLHADIYLLN